MHKTHRHKTWTRSTIKCLPVVEREYTDRNGNKRKRGIEYMLKEFERRVKKSGHLRIAKDRSAYRKPSDERRDKEQARAHLIRKHTEIEKERKRIRGDRR